MSSGKIEIKKNTLNIIRFPCWSFIYPLPFHLAIVKIEDFVDFKNLLHGAGSGNRQILSRNYLVSWLIIFLLLTNFLVMEL